MKKLESIKFTEIKEEKNYFVCLEAYERVGDLDIMVFKGTGIEVIQMIKDSFVWDGFFEENEESNLREFLAKAEEENGDGYDQITVYEI